MPKPSNREIESTKVVTWEEYERDPQAVLSAAREHPVVVRGETPSATMTLSYPHLRDDEDFA